MGEPSRNEKLEMILSGQFDRDMLTEGGRSASNIDGDIQYRAFDNAN